MRKGMFKKAIAAVMLCSIVLGQGVTSFAEEEGNSPQIVLSDTNTFEVEANKDNRIVVQLKNKGEGSADKVYVKPKNVGTNPFQVSGGGDIGSLGTNGYKNVPLNIKVDNSVEASSYSFVLEFTYTNSSGNSFSGTDTVYVKMKGFDYEPGFTLNSMVLTPESLSPGNTAVLNGKVVNSGGQTMYDVNISLDNLSSEGISLSGGFSNKSVSKIPVGGEVPFSFPLVAHTDMAGGNYPVDIKLTFKDEYGKSVEKKQQYYVNVGGVSGQKSQVEIRNMQEPGGVYGVNQNFNVSFELYNSGTMAAKNITITAEGLDPAAVVPKSSSVKTISSLEAGSSQAMSFTFAGTSQANSQNYAVQFTVEYTSGNGTKVNTFKQYAGANISNPKKDKEDDDDITSKPKIIVSNYVCDPLIVMAGEEFDLQMTLLNTHKEKDVKNIKMFLTLAEEKSSDTEKSGNIFTPVNSSNTFYFDSIASKGTVDKNLRLYVVPEAQPKTYTLTVNFEYEDAEGKEYTGTELLGINVKQTTELQMDEFTVPESVEMYAPVSVSFGYYNTGKVTLSNVMIKVEGDVDCPNKSTYIGNMEPGAGDYFETSFTPMTPGAVPVSIVLSYEDATGELKEERRDFILNVTEPMMPEEGMGENPENPPLDMKKMMISLAMIAVFGMGLFVFVRKQKGELKSSFAESSEDEFEDEDLLDDDDEEINDEEINNEEEDNNEEGMPL